MASTVRMLAAGLSLAANSFALVMFALVGGAVFTPIEAWYSSWQYSSTPVINPQLAQWIFPAFYSFLIILEIVLVIVTYITIVSRKTYYTDQGY